MEQAAVYELFLPTSNIIVDCTIFTDELCSPSARSMHSATLWGDYMVMYGGQAIDGSVKSDFYLFDTKGIKWYSYYVSSHPRAGHSVIHIPNTDVYYAIGGIESASKYSTTILKMRFGWSYAQPTGQWIEEQTGYDYAPKRRTYHAMANAGDGIYIHGGNYKDTIYGDLWVYNTTNQEWRIASSDRSLIYPVRYGHTMV